jgi:thioesterase domain-containing protein/acyl carrier protein
VLASRLAELAGKRSGGPRSGGPALAAFVTVDVEVDEPTPTPAELRSHLQGLVPGHMVPSSILLLDEIPRLPNGKIDTAALAGLPANPVELETDWVPPRNEVERKLAAIWCEVLQVDEIGVHDSFFELGGDSILSIYVTSRANQQGLRLSPNDIFNFPTIAQLAARCAESPPDGRPPLFMVQWGASEAAQLRQHLSREQPLFCFAAHWHGAYLKLSATIEQMAEERLVELRSLQPSGPYFIGGYSMGVPIALEMARQLRRQGEQVPLLFVLDPPHRNRQEEALVQTPTRRSLVQKLSWHVRTLLDLTPAEWVGHLKTETVAQVRYRVLEPLKLVWIGAMRRIGLGVPDALWRHYVGTVYLRARSRYAYGPYDGDVVIFSGSSDSVLETLSSWQDLVRGDLQVETFDGAHLDFTMDPELFARWAKRLTAVLTERQSGTRTGTDQAPESPIRGSVRGTIVASPSTATAAR